MSRKYGTLLTLIAMTLCICLLSIVIVSADDQNNTSAKDAAQLKIEALEAELGEEGMQEVEDYLELQASLPDVVKASPYSYIAFAATDEEGQLAYMTAIDESDLSENEKKQLKTDLQDIWDRYPDGFVVSDNLALRKVSKIMEERFAKANGLSEEEADFSDAGDDGSDAEDKQSPGFGFLVSFLSMSCAVLYLFSSQKRLSK